MAFNIWEDYYAAGLAFKFKVGESQVDWKVPTKLDGFPYKDCANS